MEFKKIEYKPLHAGEERHHNPRVVGSISGRTNDLLLFNNPDRGFRTTMPVVIIDEHKDPDDPTKPCPHCDLVIYDDNGRATLNNDSKCLGKHIVHRMFANIPKEENERVLDYMFDNWFFSTAKTDYKSRLILLQGGFPYGKSEKLPQAVFDILEMFFDKCRERDCKVLFRYGYHGVQYNWHVSEEFRKMHEKVGASEEIMLSHIEQLAPFIAKHSDIIHKLSSGFIASGGEQAYNYQYPVVNYDTVIKAAVEKLCVPNNFYYTVRMPKYKLDLLEHEPDYKYAHLIGHNNDAFYGETENYGWNSGCYQKNHNFDITGPGQCDIHDHGGTHVKNNWWEYVCETGAYTPQSGEMYHNVAIHTPHKVPTGMEVIKQLAHHWYVTLSQWNGFIESKFEHLKNKDGQLVPRIATMQYWIDNETITPADLDREGIIYDPAWFTDEEGNLVHRNPYEFVRDHLGYRLFADSFEFDGKTVRLTLKNYGFAAAFCLKSSFVILDENYNVVSEIAAGEPEKWYSHDPENYLSTEILEHTVSADIEIPKDREKCYIAFCLKNTRGDCARLANDPESLPFVNGCNILFAIK